MRNAMAPMTRMAANKNNNPLPAVVPIAVTFPISTWLVLICSLGWLPYVSEMVCDERIDAAIIIPIIIQNITPVANITAPNFISVSLL